MKKILATMFAMLMIFQGISSTALAVDLNPDGGYFDEAGANLPGGDGTQTLSSIISTVITTILSVLGILLLGMIIFSGFEYMTAGGDDEKTKTAMTRIKNATIGLLIIMASYAIASFIIDALETATNGPTG